MLGKRQNLQIGFFKCANNLCRNTACHNIGRQVFSYNTAGSNERIFANGYAFKHCNINTKPDIIADLNRRIRTSAVVIPVPIRVCN